MNGKKAKLLRGLAGVGSEETQKYTTTKGTQRTKKAEGAPEYTTVTIELAPSARKLYQTLKADYTAAGTFS